MNLSQDLLTLEVHFREGKFLFFFALSHHIIHYWNIIPVGHRTSTSVSGYVCT